MLHPENLTADAMTEQVVGALRENGTGKSMPLDVLDTQGLPRVCRYASNAVGVATR